MKKTDNKEMLNAIREQASAEYQDRVPTVDGREIQPRTVLAKLEQYPTIKNEFIQTLINKVVKTDFFSRVYANPLKELKKGTLPYGATIEELFVMSAEAKGFFGGSSDFDAESHASMTMADDHASLLSTEKAKIKKLYVTLNFAHVFKTSISDSQLAHAFTSANGLSELVNQIVSSLTNGAEQKEYKDMIELIKAVAQQKQLRTDGKGVIVPLSNAVYNTGGGDIPLNPLFTKSTDVRNEDAKKTIEGVIQTMFKYDIEGDAGVHTPEEEGKNLSKAIRTLTGRMKFVSTKYNMAGVPTFSNPEDLIFMTTPEVVANMDVNVLASAFNVSMADIKTRIILVDELPKKWATGQKMQNEVGDKVGYYYKAPHTDGSNLLKDTVEGDCLGILMDKNFIQAIDTVNEARQFENGRALMTNLFLHRQGMLANCYFSNCVALFTNAGYKKVAPHTQG